MNVYPMLLNHQRQPVATGLRIVTAVVRATAYLLGGLLSSIVAGFVQGWRDAS